MASQQKKKTDLIRSAQAIEGKERTLSGEKNIDQQSSERSAAGFPNNFEHIPLYSTNKTVQAKLIVNKPNDKYEQEADAIAEKIMKTPGDDQATPNISDQPNKMAQKKPIASSVSSLLQNKSGSGSATNASLMGHLDATTGSGQAMDDHTHSFMSGRFGFDFSKVKIHTDDHAAACNRQLNAKAFTVGSDIYFNRGQYKPSSTEGKQLLAHELTHTLQQGHQSRSIVQRKMGDGHDLESPRFAGNAQLEDAYDPPGPEIKKGDFGMHVRIIQQALIDTGESLKGGVDGDYKGETETAVKSFQTKQGLKGADITGTVNAKTMDLLDKYFLKHATLTATPISMVPSTAPTPAVEWPVGGAPAELSKGTRTLKSWDKTEIERRRTTEVIAPPGGALPDFKNKIATNPDTYEKRIEDITLKVVDRQFNALGKDKAAAHADPTKLHSWADIEKVAVLSKRETDRVFKNFALGKAFVHGTNIKDAWDQKEAEFAAGGKTYEDNSVEWRVNKIIQDPRVTGKIDEEHGAVQSRTTLSPGEAKSEADIIKDIRTRIISKRRAELIETHKGWSGFADPPTHTVFIQRFKSATNSENRDFMWRMFQTLVHEYIHTLAHSKYNTYADSLPEKKGGKTYREGMTEYFTKMVLESTTYDAALRTDVEGPFHEAAITHSIKPYGGYGEAANAEAVAGVAGLRNVMAAFFLGKIELIGG